jgi:dimethylglycine dehydrogenase
MTPMAGACAGDGDGGCTRENAMLRQARVVVIGGGAMGASLLYHLTQLGWRDVVLVEKNELTAGSTWHAAGLCTHFAHNLTIMQMRAHSVRLYSSILERETGQAVSFHQCGALRIARSAERMAEFAHVKGIGKFAGFEFNILSPGELKEIYPLVETDDLVGAIHEPLDGYVDPSQATHAMAAGARQGGAKIYRQNPVEAIEQTAAGEWLVRTRDGDIRCEHVVNAAGTWCREIGEMMGLDLPVVPMLHQYLVTDRVTAYGELDRELPIIRDPEESWYVRCERDGVIIGPYERAAPPWSVDGVPPEFGMELLPPDLERIEHIVGAAMTRLPVLGEAGIKTIVNGPITFTPDANPLIGPAFGLRNGWLLTGSSMGVMEGGGAGKFLAEWIVEGAPPMDALALDPRRFGAYADRSYRVDKAIEAFGHQFAIHFPFEERPAGRPVRTTPIHDDLAAAGAQFGFAYGWERPNWFAPKGTGEAALTFGRPGWFEAVAGECHSVAESAGLADMSVFSKFNISGKDATAFMETLGANRPPRGDGRVGLTHALTKEGGVRSEFTVTRVNADHYYLTSAAAAHRHDHDLLAVHSRDFEYVGVEDVTASYGVISLMGPKAREILAPLCDQDLCNDAFAWLSAREMTVAGVPVRALRVSYVGELGWELHHDMKGQKALYDAVLEAGRPHGLGHFGAYAMNAMRLEKGYRAWGSDLSTERTPLEAGLAHLVRAADRTFTGRDALLAPPTDKSLHMMLLSLEEVTADPFALHTVFMHGRVCGLVTSGAFGHRVGKPLALAYLDPVAARAGEGLEVEILGRRVAARCLAEPPYDPANDRLRHGG